MMRHVALIFLYFGFYLASYCQQPVVPIRFMFWNVENAFDTDDDPLTSDDDFLPSGIRRWSRTRYFKKLNDIAKTIIAAGEWDTPAIIGLCEVENRKVIEDLIFKTALQRFQFDIVHEDSPDERGIDVCLIYRRDILQVITYRYILPPGAGLSDYNTRTILLSMIKSGEDTLHLFLNHWPSRVGGVLASEDKRSSIAAMVRSYADSIISLSSGKAKIIIAGDFNCTPVDDEIKKITGTDINSGFVNLSTGLTRANEGSYRYHGIWEMIDQVIVSRYLLEAGTGLYLEDRSLSLFKPGFLLVEDPAFPGEMPFSTYRGMRYKGGISDHLPVILDLHGTAKE